ncbi:hypothetical protein B0O80DRAFT_529856 [Mortierella sp. GBAus27b]|nr:hypothetical protein BGX31_008060 [Mortierella sp. GBA43]KAI8353107.1 hypothetical protein B0O80DRAFT_529856 [Mortierella sp. GBAus27b]
MDDETKLLQEFRDESSSKVIAIPTQYDPKTAQQIVLWKDIQQCFGNAKSIMNDKNAVLFVTDGNSVDLHPLRIAHHPGKVLDVLVADGRTGSPASSHSRDLSLSLEFEADMDILASMIVEPLSDESLGRVSRQNMHEPTLFQGGAIAANNSTYSLIDNNNDNNSSSIVLQEQVLVQQQLQELQQANQQTREQHQQQTDDILQRIQQSDQQAYEMQQQLNQVLETIRQLKLQPQEPPRSRNPQEIPPRYNPQNSCENWGQQDDDGLQIQKRVFDRLMTIQSRIQALLATSSQDLSSPRLFIVLPETDKVVQDGASCPVKFRLFYLCECGTHTMGEDGRRTHEIHLADHPGYTLDNHNAFFEKHGAYLLTMMYMVKYGAVVAGRVVLPPSGLRPAKSMDTSRDQGQSGCNYNFGNQVDEMIAYLENMDSINNVPKNSSSHWRQSPFELAQLKTHMRIKGGESVFGNLNPMMTQDRHCIWICREHQREYHKSVMQQLSDLVHANNGNYSEEQGRIKMKIESALLTRQFFNAIEKMLWTQRSESQWPLTTLDLKLGCHCSPNMSMGHILVNLNTIGSLTLDSGRFTLTIDSSQGATRHVEIEMAHIGDLTPDDVANIQRCQYQQLVIRNTPQKEDEDRLESLLRSNTKLKRLRIGCHAARAFAVIQLVVSTREKVLRMGVVPSLHTLEVLDDGLVSFDIDRPNDSRDHVESTIRFSTNSEVFDMQTHVKLRKGKAIAEDDPICALFQHYGWSFETLDAPSTFSNPLAACLHEGTRERGSQITFLSVTPTSLTTRGLEALDQVIKISPCSEYLRLPFNYLDQPKQLDKAVLLLSRYKEKVNNLGLYGTSLADWLPQITRAFPTRDYFPKLSVLGMKSHTVSEIPQECIPWIVAMVSTPPLMSSSTLPGSLPSPLPSPSAVGPMVEIFPDQVEKPSRLERFTLNDVTLGPDDWVSVIEAIDFGALVKLNLKDTNFSHKELELLVHRIVNNKESMATMPLRSLCLDKHLLENEAGRALRAKLREKAPIVKIK